jgi:amino acid adenylation domain-containing protein
MEDSAMPEIQDCTNGGLRFDFVRKDGTVSNGTFAARLPDDLADLLNALANGNAFQAYVALLAAMAIHLRQHSDQERFVVYSAPLRNGSATPFPVRIDFEGLRTFEDVFESVRQQQGISLSRPESIRSRSQEGAVTLVSMDGLHADAQGEPVEFHVRYMPGTREMVYRYDQALYRPDTIACTAARIFDLLRTGVGDPKTPLKNLGSIQPPEAALICGKWNDTEVDYPRDRSLQSLFEETLTRYPDRVGCICNGRSYTYAELGEAAGNIAAALHARGLRPAGVVALFAGRSFAAVAAMLGILRAGASYLPLDRSYPGKRIAYLLSDAEPDFVVAERQLVADLPQTSATVLCADDLLQGGDRKDVGLPNLDCPTAPAYLIYTSGSTGNPKGVVLDHRGRINNFFDFNRRFGIGPGDCVLGVSSMSFDMSAYDTIGTFMAGSKLVLVSEDEHSAPSEWLDLMGREQVTIWHSVPSLMEALLDHAERYERATTVPQSLRLVLLGGDWIPVGMPDRIRNFWPDARVISLGGATEVSMDSTLYEVEATQQNWKSIPYGRAMANQKSYVLDRSQSLAPPSIAGELFLGGDGVGWGYHRQPRVSAVKFIPDGFTGRPGARLYATGDLARYQPDGQLELLGRLDFQVKIRGLRIELGEIEAALQDFPHVTRAVALVKDDNRYGALIVAYVAVTGDLDLQALRVHLAERLPYYMIPHQTVPLRELPLSANGKIDRGALRNLETAPIRETPDTPITGDICSIFVQLLSLDRVGADEDFFALGGHSLLALQLIARLEEVFGVKTPLPVIFESPTPAGLANYIGRQANAAGLDLREAIRR